MKTDQLVWYWQRLSSRSGERHRKLSSLAGGRSEAGLRASRGDGAGSFGRPIVPATETLVGPILPGGVYRGIEMPGTLNGIRVVDLTHVLNGPFCTLLLGHMGAEVIKIENGAGDRYRHAWLPKGVERDSYAFVAVNSNKKGININLKSAEGKDLLRRLVERSDVLVENFGAGVMERLGLDYETLSRIRSPSHLCLFARIRRDGPVQEYPVQRRYHPSHHRLDSTNRCDWRTSPGFSALATATRSPAYPCASVSSARFTSGRKAARARRSRCRCRRLCSVSWRRSCTRILKAGRSPVRPNGAPTDTSFSMCRT